MHLFESGSERKSLSAFNLAGYTDTVQSMDRYGP